MMFNCCELITLRMISPAFLDELMDSATIRMTSGVVMVEFRDALILYIFYIYFGMH